MKVTQMPQIQAANLVTNSGNTAHGVDAIRPIGTNFSEMLIEIQTFPFKKMHLKILSGKWRPFCLGRNVLGSGGVFTGRRIYLLVDVILLWSSGWFKQRIKVVQTDDTDSSIISNTNRV